MNTKTFSCISAACLSISMMESMAASHALIMTIGKYSDPTANLNGIEIDAANAKKIALSMGIPAQNIVELSDSQLTVTGISSAMSSLINRTKIGDKVFVYYSGHGGQVPGGEPNVCSEGIVAYDLKLYEDQRFSSDLQKIAARAGQVIMMNDSCFAGGLIDESKSLGGRSVGATPPQAKAIKFSKSGTLTGDKNYTCGHAVNAKMSRNLQVIKADGSRYVYIAAASDREVAWATSSGSSATNAWLQCLSGTTDRDRSGNLTGREVQQCAQAALSGRFNQTITLVGDSALPLSMLPDVPGWSASAGQAVSPLHALQDIASGGSEKLRVQLSSRQDRLVINKDLLDFVITTDRPGYLYLLHAGSDGKTFDQLFPNSIDSNHFIQAGTHNLPRDKWRVKAGGPAGTSYVLAVVSETPRDFVKALPEKMGPFSAAPATVTTSRNLIVSATGDATAGRYGASAVISIREEH